MSLSGIHKESFKTRLAVADIYTSLLMKLLKKTGHFSEVVRKATKEEEDQGIDWWVKYTSTEVKPSQFKLREKRYDCPVCRFQPLHGLDSPRNVIGRDFRGLRDKMSEHYYVAVRDEDGLFDSVYRLNSATLGKLVMEADAEWATAITKPTSKPKDMWGGTYNKDYFTSSLVQEWTEQKVSNKLIFSASNGIQFWWKKNFNEGSPKINMYVPRKYKDWDYDINASDARLIEKVFKQINGSSKSFIE